MNKGEFINYISANHSCTKVDAEKTIDMWELKYFVELCC